MRELASYVMRGPKQAAWVALVCMAVPLLFWIGSAIVALVVLRHGISEGLKVAVWPLIPAIAWLLSVGDPGAFIALVQAFAMASALRAFENWNGPIATGAVVSVLTAMFVPTFAPEATALLVEMAQKMFEQWVQESQLEYTPEMDQAVTRLIVASFAMTFYGVGLGSLCLARSWQAHLYNPGGWATEFHSLRLNVKSIAGFAAAGFVANLIDGSGGVIMVTFIAPAILCGIALVHGVIARRQVGKGWLFGFYLFWFLMLPTVTMVLVMFAVMDALLDFRGKMDRMRPMQ